jgi:hypothetical protein
VKKLSVLFSTPGHSFIVILGRSGDSGSQRNWIILMPKQKLA